MLIKVERGVILKLFLNIGNFEPQYSYRLYSYKKSLYGFIYRFVKKNEKIKHISKFLSRKELLSRFVLAFLKTTA